MREAATRATSPDLPPAYYWWHDSVLQEMFLWHLSPHWGSLIRYSLTDNLRYTAKFLPLDSRRYIDQLLAWGFIAEGSLGDPTRATDALTLTDAGLARCEYKRRDWGL